MKKIFLALLLGLIFSGTSFAGEPGRLLGGKYVQEGYVNLPLENFRLVDAAEITTSTTPGYEVDDNMMSLVWADGESASAIQTFLVPPNYGRNGRFVLMATASAIEATPNKIDFDVYVNKAGTDSDAAVTDQTPVALTKYASSSPSKVTLVPATDFQTVSGGDWVTIRICRDDPGSGTADLEVKSVSFIYDPIYK